MDIKSYLEALSGSDESLGIVTDEAACAAYVAENRSRMPAAAPAAILYPTTSEQVQDIVKKANEYSVNLVVRSSQGSVSTRGASLPVEGTECVAVNLSRMNKIMNIDPLNNMAIIEAGVTYGQLNEALKPYGLYVEHPLAPREEKSVLASLIDRDPVMTPRHLWDVPDPLCAVEMVMGKGRLFRSGSAAGPGSLEEMLEAGCGINQAQGPVWLDLARVITGSQGTLAIVTWASVKVRRIGSCYTLTYVQSDDIDKLAAYASQVIRRRLGEEAVLLNRRGMVNVFGLDPERAAVMPKWTYISSVRGFRYFPEMYMENQLLDMTDIAGEFGLELKTELAGLNNEDVRERLESTSDAENDWRTRGGESPVDVFFLNEMTRIGSFTSLAEETAAKCGADPEDLLVYAQPSQMGRNCHIEFILPAGTGHTAEPEQEAGSECTERTAEPEQEAGPECTADSDREARADSAAQLEETLSLALLDSKAFFSRPYGPITEEVYNRYADQKKYMPIIKEFFDENRIMAPGRLCCQKGGE